jgi:hypothetical protein
MFLRTLKYCQSTRNEFGTYNAAHGDESSRNRAANPATTSPVSQTCPLPFSDS